jgi:hypothetical protein
MIREPSQQIKELGLAGRWQGLIGVRQAIKLKSGGETLTRFIYTKDGKVPIVRNSSS